MAVLPADVESRKKTLIEVTQLILLVRCPGATILNDRPITPPDAPYHTQLVLFVRYSGTKTLNDRPIPLFCHFRQKIIWDGYSIRLRSVESE
jgi:hypothetical protein